MEAGTKTAAQKFPDHNFLGLNPIITFIKFVLGLDLTTHQGSTESGKCPEILRKVQLTIILVYTSGFATCTLLYAVWEFSTGLEILSFTRICMWITTIMPQIVGISFIVHLASKAPEYRNCIRSLGQLFQDHHQQWYLQTGQPNRVRTLCLTFMAIEFLLAILEALLILYANFVMLMITAKSLKDVGLYGLCLTQYLTLKMISLSFRTLFVVCCHIIGLAFEAMVALMESNHGAGMLAWYQYHHRQACRLIREADNLFSGILCLTLFNDFVYIVINAKLLLALNEMETTIFTVVAIALKILSSGIKCIYASKVNKQVMSTLKDAIRTTSVMDLSSFEKEHGNYLVYVSTLTVDFPAITYGGLFAVRNETFLTFTGTVLSYIFILKDMH